MASSAEPPERYAMVICDAQPDLLQSLSEGRRADLVKDIRCLLQGARNANWTIIFTGIRFASGYAGVPSRHRTFGGLQRLNARQGDERVHWFMEGFPGSEIHPDLSPLDGEVVLWRQQLRHNKCLIELLREKGVTKVALAGLKSGQGVLAAAEDIADEGLLVYVAREAVADDNEERHLAVLDHVLPQFADVLSLEDFRSQISQEIMMDMYIEFHSAKRAG
eukprot:TRINITY_DN40603_c0_g1_i1.p1 TRINITY_DN40603_c0_g1~~TRINITY_DN40603_c0_g1_i1.p1  ORF type:complete len:220 (-),score=47.79 TRINITY_DN40603_c0_g1_i1:79-738(-)